MDPLVGLAADHRADRAELRDVAMARRTLHRGMIQSQWVAWLNTMSAERLLMMKLICQQEGIDEHDEAAVTRRWQQEMEDLASQLRLVDEDLHDLHIKMRGLQARRRRLREMLGLSPTRRST